MEKQIDSIKNALREIMRLISSRGGKLSDKLKTALAKAMEYAASRISQLRTQQREQSQVTAPIEGQPIQEEQATRPPQQAPPREMGHAPSGPLQLMWILAGQDEQAFLSYLQNYPDPSFNSLLRNRPELERTINFLKQMMPAGEQPVSPEGIPHADINSSNIYGFQYDPKTSNLKVQFQGGGVYGYEGVPGWIFNLFKQGAVAAKTQGQNQYGRWWIGKKPSLGASFFALIKNGGYPYQKLTEGATAESFATKNV